MMVVSKPSNRWESVGRHLPLFSVGAALLGVSFLPLAWLPGLPCTFLKLTGEPCPFCGMSRAFHYAAALEWPLAVSFSPLGFFLFFANLGLVFWHGTALAIGWVIQPGGYFTKAWLRRILWFVLAGSLMVNWIWIILLKG